VNNSRAAAHVRRVQTVRAGEKMGVISSRPIAEDWSIGVGSIKPRLSTNGSVHAWEFEKNGREMKVHVEGQLAFNSLPAVERGIGRMRPGLPSRGIRSKCTLPTVAPSASSPIGVRHFQATTSIMRAGGSTIQHSL
jgi:hypothetical protein